MAGATYIALTIFVCVLVIAAFQLRAPIEQRQLLKLDSSASSSVDISTLSTAAIIPVEAPQGQALVLKQPPSPPPPPSQALDPPAGINLTRATLAALTRGCNGGRSGDGVTCTSSGVEALLSHAAERRFDTSRRNPCTASFCVPYFYILGTFHAGVRDLYDRLLVAHPRTIFVPKARRDGSYPYYFSETHPWERMLWRGCDYGACPRQRGVGAEPLALSRLPEMAEGRVGARDKVFGEVAGNALTFTWSSAHSVLHFAWDRNQSKCRSPHPRTRCFPEASAAQREWEASVGGGSAREFTIPYLMRGVHGTDKIRLIGLVREPAERMWSAYWFWPQYRRRYGKHAEGFVKYATQMMEAFDACLATVARGDEGGAWSPPQARGGGAEAAQRRLEHCAVNFESLSAANEGVYYHADQLLRSLYAAYVPTWLCAFGRQRLLLLRAEDYWADRGATLHAVSCPGVSRHRRSKV